MKSIMLPEEMYEFCNLDLETVKEAYKTNKTITGFVESLDAASEEIIVQLGDNLYAKMKFDQTTIYPYTYSNNPNRPLPLQICCLLHKNIRIKVKDITDNTIWVSRKKNMEEAFEYLKTCSSVMFHIFSTTVQFAFGDVGDGILGRLYFGEISRMQVRNISEYVHKNDNIWVNVIAFDDTKRLRLSYKSTFPEYNPSDFQIGDSVTAKVGEFVDDTKTAYFMEITPQVSGIMDLRPWEPLLNYGDKVECIIKAAKTKGLKLKFARFIKHK